MQDRPIIIHSQRDELPAVADQAAQIAAFEGQEADVSAPGRPTTNLLRAALAGLPPFLAASYERRLHIGLSVPVEIAQAAGADYDLVLDGSPPLRPGTVAEVDEDEPLPPNVIRIAPHLARLGIMLGLLLGCGLSLVFAFNQVAPTSAGLAAVAGNSPTPVVALAVPTVDLCTWGCPPTVAPATWAALTPTVAPPLPPTAQALAPPLATAAPPPLPVAVAAAVPSQASGGYKLTYPSRSAGGVGGSVPAPRPTPLPVAAAVPSPRPGWTGNTAQPFAPGFAPPGFPGGACSKGPYLPGFAPCP